MKNKILLALVILIVGFGANAQTFKFGHINGAQLMSIMPERDSAQAELQELSKTYGDQIELMQVELNNKYQDYVNNQATLTAVIKQTKEQELQGLQQRIQEFQQNAQRELQAKEQALIQPIMKKAEEAIKKVSKENGFTYVFDISTGALMYFSEQSIDIMPLVKKELNIE